MSTTRPVPEIDEATWDRVIQINLTGAFLMTKAAIPAMVARGGGSIILIASQLGRVARPGRAAYCATKGGLIQFAKVLAEDHAAQGIRANTLPPGAVETRRMLRNWPTMEDALYLASDASSFMTGSDLLIDGGYTAT